MNYEKRVNKAIKHFWEVRGLQSQNQGKSRGIKDTGNRRAVTGGKHLDGFVELMEELLYEAGLQNSSIHKKSTTLPGYFRATKNWDLIVVVDDQLWATIEFKAQVGSFGNNFNNRVEEALGNSIDINTAYREGKFKPSQKPWTGWLMLLEDSPESTSPISVSEPHFDVFPEFKSTSYAKRYEIFCERLVRERMYDSACLLMSDKERGLKGIYSEPNSEFGFKSFATSLIARTRAFVEMREE